MKAANGTERLLSIQLFYTDTTTPHLAIPLSKGKRIEAPTGRGGNYSVVSIQYFHKRNSHSHHGKDPPLLV